MSKEIQERLQARELLIKAKVYKAVALVMALFGLFFLFYFYASIAEGDPAVFMQNPFLILMLFLPFIPCLFFFWLAGKHSDAFYKLVYADGASAGKLETKTVSRKAKK